VELASNLFKYSADIKKSTLSDHNQNDLFDNGMINPVDEALIDGGRKNAMYGDTIIIFHRDSQNVSKYESLFFQ